MRACLGLLGYAWLTACAEDGAPYIRAIDTRDYPVVNAALGESLADGEIEAAGRIAAIIEAHLHTLYPRGPLYRDAHPKAVGCVDATFTVEPGLGPPFNQGLFQQQHSYKALIRFSNGNENRTRSDLEPDGRGMAIKVFDPPDTPLTEDPLGPPAQDFIMISHPTFIVADPKAYRATVGYTDSTDGLTQLLQPVLAVLTLGLTGVENALATTSLRIDNPLHARYWSMVPYQLGLDGTAVAVKYSANGCDVRAGEPPHATDPDFLRHAMAATLAPGGAGACMRFMIQPRTSPAMSVEDPRFEWPEQAAPFHQVATITIPAQAFDTPVNNRACELLSYSPWHAMPAHRPLGSVNRMRKVIYDRISLIRRQSWTGQPGR